MGFSRSGLLETWLEGSKVQDLDDRSINVHKHKGAPVCMTFCCLQAPALQHCKLGTGWEAKRGRLRTRTPQEVLVAAFELRLCVASVVTSTLN